jgi:Fe-Mn family superoxide dismutase
MPAYVEDHITGSFKKKATWEEDFLACGLSAKGWVVLGYDRIDKKLINVISDAHDIYVVNVDPVLVMDVYEHSYYIDFGSSKGKYIEFFLNNINWDAVASRLSEVEIE